MRDYYDPDEEAEGWEQDGFEEMPQPATSEGRRATLERHMPGIREALAAGRARFDQAEAARKAEQRRTR